MTAARPGPAGPDAAKRDAPGPDAPGPDGAADPGSVEVPAPVFILAAPRSYSSLVGTMIGQHPELYGVPELNLFQCATVAEFNSGETAAGEKKSPFWRSMRHGLLRTLSQVLAGEQTEEGVRMAERWLKARAHLSPGEVLLEVCAAVAPLRVVEKSPGVLRHRHYMDRMLEAFPDARFIHLVRHPIPQGESVLKAKGGIGVLMALAAIDQTGPRAFLEPQVAWYDAQVQILRFLDGLPEGQFVTLRGEDVLNDIGGTLGALCRWLGVSDAPEAIAAMRRPQDSPFSVVGPRNAALGNDVNFLKSPALREGEVRVPALDAPLSWREDRAPLHPRVRDLAQALGY